MKLRQARLDAGLSASELARQIRISPSYLTEIEKGRKYPKPDKIMKMAGALDLDYDDLVSILLGPSMAYLESALASPLVQQFPFDEFGLGIGDLMDILTRAPEQASTLLHAITDLARQVDLGEEHLHGRRNASYWRPKLRVSRLWRALPLFRLLSPPGAVSQR
jgi:hypothetical protein